MISTNIGSPVFPQFEGHLKNTLKEEIDSVLDLLQLNKDKWIEVDPGERISILDEINEDLLKVTDRWIAASIKAKEVPAGSFGEGEEWIMVSLVFRCIKLLRKSLTDIQKFGRPRIQKPLTTRKNGQVAANVFPQNSIDKILFKNITGEIRMKPEISLNAFEKSQAIIYNDKTHKGHVCLVLAAGNLSLLPVVDFMYKLFVEDKVVILKTNPVNEYIGPIIEDGFRALINRCFMQVVYGGIEEGSYLCNHEKVDEIHLTGSDKTFDSIVFGSGQEGRDNKLRKKPILTKHFTAELGNITPVIIVPGPWNDNDIKQQAMQIASWLVVNAGFNCLTPRVIIQHRNWNKRDNLIDAISNTLQKIETRKAYYPGAIERLNAFITEHPEAKQFGSKNNGHLPWTFITNVDPQNSNDICFKNEAFCGLFAETALEASSVIEYIENAVHFANETLWGSLIATIIIHPKSLKNPQIANAVEKAITDLRYGSVCINLRAEYAYLLMVTTWGAFPGHDIYDIQSGRGVVNNFLMFDKPEKSVIRGPFKLWPAPFNITSKHLPEFGRKMTYFEATSSFSKIPGVIWAAMKS